MVILVTLHWCRKQSNGILVIDPNENLSNEYINTAEETLEVLRNITNKSRMWLATAKYYAEYFAFYALLMRIGIKCEIHDCTIELAKFLEAESIIPKGYAAILVSDKQLRIDNQYYLKNREVDLDYTKLIEFVLTLKDICLKLTQEDIEDLRTKLSQK